MKFTLSIVLFAGLFWASGARTQNTQQTLYKVNMDSLWGFIDENGKIVIEPRFQYVSDNTGYPVDRGQCYLVAKLKDKYGILNLSGEWVIEPTYDYIHSAFCDNLLVTIASINDQMGLLNINGKFDSNFNWRKQVNDSTYLATRREENKEGVEVTTRTALVNNNLEIIKELPFDHINISDDKPMPVKKDGKWGFLDQNWELLVPCQYEEVRYFIGELTGFRQNEKWGLLNQKGEVVLEPTYDNIGAPSEGMISVLIDNKIGFLDSNLQLAIPPIYDYDEISMMPEFINGLANIMVNNLDGFIDKKGKVVIEPQYVNLSPFFGGILTKAEDTSGKWGVIDTAGNVIIDFDYNWTMTNVHGAGPLIWVEKDRLWGAFDREGNVVITCQYASKLEIAENRWIVKLASGAEEYHIIDEFGNILTERAFDYRYSVRTGNLVMFYWFAGHEWDEENVRSKDSNFGYMTLDGKVVWEPQY